jgi:hypothetical protein
MRSINAGVVATPPPWQAMAMSYRLFLGSLMLSLAVGCSASDSNSGSGGAGGGGGTAGTGGALPEGGTIDGGSDAKPPAVATLKGKVVAPQGSLPISGALVYLTTTQPDPIPSGVYCDRCVELPSTVSYTFSNPDGTFDLPAYSTGSFKLVVQKGQFRRIRTIDVTAGDVTVAQENTRLPSKIDKANGDDIPRMAVVVGAWDAIENSLGKLGLGQVDANGTLVKNSQSFDLFEYPFPPDPNYQFAPDKILKDPNVISKYHIVFIPCSGSTGTTCDDFTSGDPAVQKNLQDFVAAGGKLYVTDYSYDYVRQPWPGYIDWIDQTSEIGSACQSSQYDAPAQVEDQGLKDWLGATGITSFTIQDSWTTVDKVNPVQTTDVDGKPATITPKVWVSAQGTSYGTKPATVSFERACGRVLFSTYHTEAALAGNTILPQEAALLYVLLEVGVCVAPPVVR